MAKMPAFPPELIEFFKKQGQKGGKATARKMTPEQCTEVARKAAQARWHKRKAQKSAPKS